MRRQASLVSPRFIECSRTSLNLLTKINARSAGAERRSNMDRADKRPLLAIVVGATLSSGWARSLAARVWSTFCKGFACALLAFCYRRARLGSTRQRICPSAVDPDSPPNPNLLPLLSDPDRKKRNRKRTPLPPHPAP